MTAHIWKAPLRTEVGREIGQHKEGETKVLAVRVRAPSQPSGFTVNCTGGVAYAGKKIAEPTAHGV